MPELPEVETVRRGLNKLVSKKRVIDVKIYNPSSFHGTDSEIKKHLIKSEIKNIRRRAKVLLIDLSTNYSLVIHLKMTGQLVHRGEESWAGGHPNDSFVAKLPDRSTRIEFIFNDKSSLFFNDQRKFGWIKLLPTNEVENLDFFKKVGPEPLNGNPDLPKQFINNTRRHNNTTIKAAILNQSVVAGIGNIYADESLWCSKVHPATKVKNLSDKKLREILQCAIDVMTKSIKSGGSTMKNYIRADGTKGDYLEKFANVFRKEGQECPRCGTKIEKIRITGRGTHICPQCQKIKVKK